MPPATPPAMSSRANEGKARSDCWRVADCCWPLSAGLGIMKDDDVRSPARRLLMLLLLLLQGCHRRRNGDEDDARAPPSPLVAPSIARTSSGLDGSDARHAGGDSPCIVFLARVGPPRARAPCPGGRVWGAGEVGVVGVLSL